MARRDNTPPFEALLLIASKLPWWLSVALAAGAYLCLSSYATHSMPDVTNPKLITTEALAGRIFRTMASIGQYLIPMALIWGAVRAAITSRRGAEVIVGSSTAPHMEGLVEGVDPEQFELIAGEADRLETSGVFTLDAARRSSEPLICPICCGPKHLCENNRGACWQRIAGM
jgi:restriction system protein